MKTFGHMHLCDFNMQCVYAAHKWYFIISRRFTFKLLLLFPSPLYQIYSLVPLPFILTANYFTVFTYGGVLKLELGRALMDTDYIFEFNPIVCCNEEIKFEGNNAQNHFLDLTMNKRQNYFPLYQMRFLHVSFKKVAQLDCRGSQSATQVFG